MKPWISHIEVLKNIYRNPKRAIDYLNTSLEQGDYDAFLVALRNVTEIHGGLGKIARSAKLNREHLYRMLSKKGNPRMKNIFVLLEAMGYKISLSELNPKDIKRAA